MLICNICTLRLCRSSFSFHFYFIVSGFHSVPLRVIIIIVVALFCFLYIRIFISAHFPIILFFSYCFLIHLLNPSCSASSSLSLFLCHMLSVSVSLSPFKSNLFWDARVISLLLLRSFVCSHCLKLMA